MHEKIYFQLNYNFENIFSHILFLFVYSLALVFLFLINNAE